MNRFLTKLMMSAVAALAIGAAAACDDSPTEPSPSAVVTFAVGGESFRVALTRRSRLTPPRRRGLVDLPGFPSAASSPARR